MKDQKAIITLDENMFFLTGLTRSGTTLLSNLIDHQEKTNSYLQPAPYLFQELKKDYFEIIGHPEKHFILGHLFNETNYSPEQFYSYLDQKTISKNDLISIWKSMEDYTGQIAKISDYRIKFQEFSDSTLIDSLRFILDQLNNNEAEVKLVGLKEVNCEEYVPYFAKKNIKCVIIIRDPRDVITSMNIGKGQEFSGNSRPLLFDIRNWRKSVNIAISSQSSNNALLVKYEDLVLNVSEVMKRINHFLGIDKVTLPSKWDQTKTTNSKWFHNTSIENEYKSQNLIDLNTIGRYKSNLRDETTLYIEKTCYPEMTYLGYEFENSKDAIKSYKLNTFKEEFDIRNNNIDHNYSISTANIELENDRFNTFINAKKIKDSQIRLLSSKYFTVDNVLKKLLI